MKHQASSGAKNSIRKTSLESLKKLSVDQITSKSKKISERLLTEFPEVQNLETKVLGYRPIQWEPRVNLDHWEIAPSKSGIKTVASDYKYIIVPGIAFDLNGYRLGRGGGWYDRFLLNLEQSTTVIGVCYRDQVLDNLPAEDHDQRVGYLITDEEVINI